MRHGNTESSLEYHKMHNSGMAREEGVRGMSMDNRRPGTQTEKKGCGGAGEEERGISRCQETGGLE